MATKQRKRNSSKTITAKAVTAGTVMRLEAPKSRRKKAKVSDVAVVVAQEINPVTGFTDFLREHAIVGLSIGFIIGSQMAAFVKVLVSSLFDPLTKLFFGTKLSARQAVLHFHGRDAVFLWGVVVYNLIIILFVLIFIYLAVRIFSLDKLDKTVKKDE